MIQILFVSLGCDKNLVDSEMMLGLLQDKGYGITSDEKEADVAVVNTCCFIHDAKEESIETIIELGQLKKGRLKALIVTGCLAQRYHDEIRKELPEVDAVLGSGDIGAIVAAVEEVLAGQAFEQVSNPDEQPLYIGRRLTTPGNFMGYLKLAEGCDKHCTYCIIPKIRGRYRSVPMEDLVRQAEELVALGISELCLVAQETTLYGVDLYGEKKLPELLRKLAGIADLKWIRLLYCYPEEITDELVMEIRDNPKVCHYLDMPIQHCEDSVLKRMGRRTTKSALKERILQLREKIPDMVLRTTLITGFPGETEEDHRNMLEFVDEMEFDRLGVFSYSAEEGTPAYEYPDQVPEETKERWRDELMELQQEVSHDRNRMRIGQTLQVVVDGYLYEDQMYVCRSYMDAPEIDGCVFVSSKEELMTGSFIEVTITGCNEYDLIGVKRDELTE